MEIMLEPFFISSYKIMSIYTDEETGTVNYLDHDNPKDVVKIDRFKNYLTNKKIHIVD